MPYPPSPIRRRREELLGVAKERLSYWKKFLPTNIKERFERECNVKRLKFPRDENDPYYLGCVSSAARILNVFYGAPPIDAIAALTETPPEQYAPSHSPLRKAIDRLNLRKVYFGEQVIETKISEEEPVEPPILKGACPTFEITPLNIKSILYDEPISTYCTYSTKEEADKEMQRLAKTYPNIDVSMSETPEHLYRINIFPKSIKR